MTSSGHCYIAIVPRLYYARKPRRRLYVHGLITVNQFTHLTRGSPRVTAFRRYGSQVLKVQPDNKTRRYPCRAPAISLTAA